MKTTRRAAWPVIAGIALVLFAAATTRGTMPCAYASGTEVAQAAPLPPPPPDETPAGSTEAPRTVAPPAGEEPQTSPQGGGRQLLLPEISFIGMAQGKLSTDHRDKERDRLKLQSGEIAIQSYVYPDVRAEADVTADADEGLAFGLEEAFILDEQLARGLSGKLGKFFVPFGRTNNLHRHSWLYVRRPLALQNLVAPEALSGQGASLSWLVPTGGKLFTQLDVGFFSSPNVEEAGAPDLDNEIAGANGAQFRDQFTVARLWAAYPPAEASELELGGSWMQGRGFPRIDGDLGTSPDIRVTGADLSYRQFGREARRLLLRAEHLWYHDPTGPASTRGYYALADCRLSKYNEFGLLYDWSGIPTLPGTHESAFSGIYTRQFTEQTYGRLQLTHGSRPGKQDYNEVWLELVWGMGPHTHNLE